MGLGDTEYKGPFQSLAIFFIKVKKGLRGFVFKVENW